MATSVRNVSELSDVTTDITLQIDTNKTGAFSVSANDTVALLQLRGFILSSAVPLESRRQSAIHAVQGALKRAYDYLHGYDFQRIEWKPSSKRFFESLESGESLWLLDAKPSTYPSLVSAGPGAKAKDFISLHIRAFKNNNYHEAADFVINVAPACYLSKATMPLHVRRF